MKTKCNLQYMKKDKNRLQETRFINSANEIYSGK